MRIATVKAPKLRAISYAMTTEAVKHRRKTVTRRDWMDKYGASWNEGDLAWAIDKGYYVGGKRFGIVQLTEKPHKELTCDIPDSDYEAEGFAFMDEQGLMLGKEETCRQRWEAWRGDPRKEAWVVRFDIRWIEGEHVPGDLLKYFCDGPIDFIITDGSKEP